MKDIRDLLGEHPTFGNFHDSLLDLMAGCGQNVHFAPGESIVKEGESAGTFYLLRNGRVGIEISVPHRGAVVIETLGAGEILGVSWPFPPYRWTFDGKAGRARTGCRTAGSPAGAGPLWTACTAPR